MALTNVKTLQLWKFCNTLITINLLKDQILLGIKLFKLFNFYKRKLKVKVLIVWLFLISTIR